MSEVTITDRDGCEMKLGQYQGTYVPPFGPGLKDRMEHLATLKGRDEDILILAYPKSGTHWTWEMVQMLFNNRTENMAGEKGEEFLEAVDQDKLEKTPSPRVLNSHIRPRLLPPDVINRKCKMIYIQRNPKDVMVSLYNHCINLHVLYKYKGTFPAFFDLAMDAKVESGSWFDYSLEYEEFFKKHPELPVLRLHYEDMKKDLLSNVRSISQFCNFPVSDETLQGITDACTFSSMKKSKANTVSEERAKRLKDGTYNMYRKGVSGDWKNYFTVAQNEVFDAQAESRLAGSDVTVKWVL